MFNFYILILKVIFRTKYGSNTSKLYKAENLFLYLNFKREQKIKGKR